VQEARIASFDGVAIRAYSAGGTGGRECVLIALPLGAKPSLIEPAVSELARSYNVLTWEARLILEPEVELPDRAALSIQANVEDVTAILAAFEISSAFLIGYCSGAAVALHAAAASWGWLKGVALVNGAYFRQDGACDCTQYEKDVMALMPTVASDYRSASYVHAKFFKNHSFSRNGNREFREEFERPYASADSLYRFGVGLHNFMLSDLRGVAREVKAPAFVATGKRDDQTHYSSSLLFRSELGNGEIVVDEAGDHYEFCRAKPALLRPLTNFFEACR
jgi:pimeloyl-ACP methyl ester carboxylesterase